ncbi:MAG: hypothetical protein HUU54_09455 [Ignavibacteriaceae bacterium]|nr:hypothetical protein [Ignavibacteriaceae bacterium]
MKKILSVLTFSLLMLTSVNAQTLEETLQNLSKDAASAYVNPIISGFGANLNTGWMHRVPSAKFFGIDLEFGVIAMATMFNDENKAFTANGNFRFDRAQAEQLIPSSYSGSLRTAMINEIVSRDFAVDISGPTIVGKKDDSVVVTFPGQNISVTGFPGSYPIPTKVIGTPVKGFLEDATALPLFLPQISIGTIYGTSVALRYLPAIDLADLGEFSYFGIGAMHNPGIWFPNPLPVDLAVGFFTQNLDVGDIFSAKSTSFGLYASRSFGFSLLNITPYAGFGFESSNVTIKYTQKLELTAVPGSVTEFPIEFEMEGKNKSRIILGASLKLLAINLNVDYNISEYNTISGGIGIIF